jgi:hypothetical protein
MRRFQRAGAALDPGTRRFHRRTGLEDTMRIRRIGTFIFCATIAALAGSLPAQAGPFERLLTRNTGYVPSCDSSLALSTIAWRFGYKERRFWASSESISQFGDVREIAFRPWGPDFIPRRFCSAKVRVSESRDTTVYYSIVEKAGFAGVGWGVEWCVVGYDRNLAFAPNCRAARP